MYIILFLSIVSYRWVYIVVPFDSHLIPICTVFSYPKSKKTNCFH